MEIPNNIYGWLSHTLLSHQKSVGVDLEIGYEAAVVSLSKQELLLVDESLRLDLFDDIIKLIIQTKNAIREYSTVETELKLKLLDNFETKTKKILSPQITDITSNIQWNGNKEILCQIFMQLKKLNTKKNVPYIPNSVEEIALFLKNNFETYKDTKVETIQRVLHDQSNKIADGATYFSITRNEKV
jgi:hypothetical protein